MVVSSVCGMSEQSTNSHLDKALDRAYALVVFRRFIGSDLSIVSHT
jgi:hypothetical protein